MTATAERRHSERRSRHPDGAEQAFFGADDSHDGFDPGHGTPRSDDQAAGDDDEARFESSLSLAGFEPDDSSFMARQAQRVVVSGQTGFERLYRAFLTARAALGVALMVTLVVASLFGLRPDAPVGVISVVYATLSISMWLLPRFRRLTPSQQPGPKASQKLKATPNPGATPRARLVPRLARLSAAQWLATIGADLLCFMALHVLTPGTSLNYAALLVLPVLMAGVLTPRSPALATAAGTTLALLGSAWLSVLAGGDSAVQLTQAALAGSGLFVLTVLAGELAVRLAREELAARGSLEIARQQARLNRLVIEEMQDGVLVVDRAGRVRAANPAARRLLVPHGMSRAAPFQLRGVAAWAALVTTVERAFGEIAWPAAGRDVLLSFAAGVENAATPSAPMWRADPPAAGSSATNLAPAGAAAGGVGAGAGAGTGTGTGAALRAGTERTLRAGERILRAGEQAAPGASQRPLPNESERSLRGASERIQRSAERTLRVRVRFTRKREPHAVEEFCVLFLEDVRNMQARSRQDKLAAMGRVSAGIAHEIRNPLAAIAQANALLAEDSVDATQRQLTKMVSDNVERLKRIVDDVMEVAPGIVPDVGVVDATALITAACADWARAVGIALGEASVLQVDVPTTPVGVSFDAEHLRRVLVNLLDNARRYASSEAGAIHLRLDSRRDDQAFLSIASDGVPIPPEVEPYLFEPFFSTRSGGTGLGLYICRELCERYGASIDYRLRWAGETQRNEFFVDMRRRPLASLAPLDNRPADSRPVDSRP